jgi:hypothetical protein
MKTSHDIMRRRLLLDAGVEKITLEDLYESEWSPRFEYMMRHRLIMGSFRYELFEEKKRKLEYDMPGEAIRRIKAFQKSGNLEHLVDAANMLLIEFECGNHPKRHFSATDDGMHNTKNEPRGD